LLLDVGFNREVGEDGAIYWKKDELARVIEEVEGFDQVAITDLDFKESSQLSHGKRLCQIMKKCLKDRE